jgi:membrane-bound metal-dependent hydrolase YbcI (DUF457 family)
MYAGHLGFALGAQSFRRTLPLWLILIAAQVPDWLDAGMCLADADRGPYGLYTHGLIPVVAAALAFGVLTWLIVRDPIGALLVAGVVLSHYALDYFTGQKPTWPGGPIIGLDLYARPMLDLVLETATVVVGWLLYRRSLPRAVRNDGMVYATLFALIAVQIIAGVAFALNLGGHVKC